MSRSYSVSDTKLRSFNLQNKKDKDSNYNNSLTLRLDEFQAIKKNSIVLSKDEQNRQSQHHDEMKEQKAQQLRDKKLQMQTLYNDKKNHIPLSEDDQFKINQRELANERVFKEKYQQNDHNKQMNKMVDYAKCVMVRDQQLIQKSEIKKKEKNYDQMLEYTVELGRLQKIKQEEDIKNQRKIDNLNALLIQQDEKRQRKEMDRLKQQQENQKLLQEALDNKEKDRQQLIQHKIKQSENNLSLMHENQKAVQYKEQQALKREEEMRQIIKYNQEKIKKEQEFQDQQKKLKDEKEKEIQRLRELQEKAGDKQSDIDAIQARRATEAKERVAREREQAQLEKKVYKFKKRQKTNMNYFKIEKNNKEIWLKDQNNKHKKKKMIFLEFIKKFQIKNRNKIYVIKKLKILDINIKNRQENRQYKKKKITARAVLEEGKLLKDEIHGEIEVLEKMRQEKMQWYNDHGVEKKYQIELGKKKIVY